MSIRGDIYLGVLGSESLLDPFGRTFTKTETEATREERTIDGTLKKDIMYKKHTFSLNYNVITGTSLDAFHVIYDLDQELNLIYWETETQYIHSVYMKPFKRKRDLLLSDGLYGGVNIQLIEA